MKKIVLMFILMALATGCHHRFHNEVVGSGVRQTQKREVPAFTSVSTEGAFDVEVVCQKTQDLAIEGDDNILPLITTEVSGNVLHIRNLHNYSVHDGITIKIQVPNLEGLSATGAGKIAVSGLKNDKFEVEVSGAPAITLSGETKVVDIDTSGAGRIDAHKLRAGRAVVDSKGVSQVEVYAAEELNVTVSGPSHVIYQGNPVVNKTVHGPGSVEKKESSPA